MSLLFDRHDEIGRETVKRTKRSFGVSVSTDSNCRAGERLFGSTHAQLQQRVPVDRSPLAPPLAPENAQNDDGSKLTTALIAAGALTAVFVAAGLIFSPDIALEFVKELAKLFAPGS
jgi:hypothetical protein